MTQINMDPAELQEACNRIDRWAHDLTGHVNTTANAEVAHVQSLPHFSGEAAAAYKQKFDEIAAQIRQQIETISDQQIGEMRRKLEHLKMSFQDLDSQVAQGLR